MSTKHLDDDEEFDKTGTKTFQDGWEGILPDGSYGKCSKESTCTVHVAKSTFKVTVGGVDYYGDEAKKKMREMMGMFEEKAEGASKTEGGSPPPSYPPPAAPAPRPTVATKKVPTERSSYTSSWNTLGQSGLVDSDGVLRVGRGTTMYIGSGNTHTSYEIGPDGKMVKVVRGNPNFVGTM
jgi:hypothetical protein